VGAGASFGGAVVVVGLLVFRSWQATGAALPDNVPLLSGPLLTGIVAGITTTWLLSRPIVDVWQRAICCGLALFGSAMLAALAAPADALGGRWGLVAYGAALTLSGWSALRRARRARQSAK
jgi:hypothetical protein